MINLALSLMEEGGYIMNNDYTPVVIMCNNCFHQLEAWKTPDGLIKKKCPYCGAVSITKQKSRRVVVIEVHAPEGQVVL